LDRSTAGGALFTSEFDTDAGARLAVRWIVGDDGTQTGTIETKTVLGIQVSPAPPLILSSTAGGPTAIVPGVGPGPGKETTPLVVTVAAPPATSGRRAIEAHAPVTPAKVDAGAL